MLRFIVALLVATDIALASSALSSRDVMARRHSSLARRDETRLTRRAQRCKVKQATVNTGNGTQPPVSGLISTNWTCNGQASGATALVTPTAGPNGLQSWLNCGINSKSGWNPPKVTVKDIVTMDLATALQSNSSPFHACKPFLSSFEKYADMFDLPAIMLASFAMQESGCNPKTIGGAGEQGLMQITHEKCVGAPGGNCLDPDFNIHQAASYFSQTLKDDNGNIMLSVGRYNGWFQGMTYAKATAAAHTSCCRCMQNLDYLMQFFNGWLLNLNPYKLKLGSVFNLAVCKEKT